MKSTIPTPHVLPLFSKSINIAYQEKRFRSILEPLRILIFSVFLANIKKEEFILKLFFSGINFDVSIIGILFRLS